MTLRERFRAAIRRRPGAQPSSTPPTWWEQELAREDSVSAAAKQLAFRREVEGIQDHLSDVFINLKRVYGYPGKELRQARDLIAAAAGPGGLEDLVTGQAGAEMVDPICRRLLDAHALLVAVGSVWSSRYLSLATQQVVNCGHRARNLRPPV